MRIPLIITGFDIFSKNMVKSQRFLNFMFYLIMGDLTICLFYSITQSKHFTLADITFDVTGFFAYLSIITQLTYFWKNQNTIRNIFHHFKLLHSTREENWTNNLRDPLYAKCSTFLKKLCKTLVVFSFICGISSITNLMKPKIELLYPIKNISFGKAQSKLDFSINFTLQAIGLFYWNLAYFINLLIFFVMIINVLTELKFISEICETVGDRNVHYENGCIIVKPYDPHLPKKAKIPNSFLVERQERLQFISNQLRTIIKYHSNTLKTLVVFSFICGISSITNLMKPKIELLYPIKNISFGKAQSKLDFTINFTLQAIGLFYWNLAYFINLLIFFVMIINVLTELKFISEICETVGDRNVHYENDCIIVKPFDPHLPKKAKKPNSLLVERQERLNFISNQLRTIVKYHSNTLKLLDLINKIYSINILIWEAIFVCAGCALYVLCLFAPGRAVSFAPILITVGIMYFSVSYLSALLSENFANVGHSLYASNWYLLNVEHKKTILTILLMAYKNKSAHVGPFGNCNLERFTEALKMVYRICLLIKYLCN
uniref:CSON011577 protein n=1 Tax=Culicoides sonorensis TaxID=179676 RepID=A0A336M3K6_CULSO